jgi:phosphohistidine phosphatase
MKQLYLLRHGIAQPHGTPGVAENDRRLTPKGRKRMREVAAALRRLDLKLDRIITSPLPRARETAEIVAEVLEIESRLETCEALSADRDAASLQVWLPSRAEERLMLVGHNPSLSDLIGVLLIGGRKHLPCELRKGGLAALSANGRQTIELDWVATPRLLRRLSGE